MTTIFRDQRILPYPPEFLFELVMDVENYPLFLPWCRKVDVIERAADHLVADVTVGHSMFTETFRTHVKPIPTTTIDIHYIKGPMDHLKSRWDFIPHIRGTDIKFHIELSFRSFLLNKMIALAMEPAIPKMISAFESRAQNLYRPPL